MPKKAVKKKSSKKKPSRRSLGGAKTKSYAPLVDKELLKILACPVCKADVKLIDLRGKKKSPKERKWDGKLVCVSKKCGITYPIEDGIPIMLPPELR
jgi:uncharacterized protein YbaR (Trm112 family)